jgi:hypothetical protein
MELYTAPVKDLVRLNNPFTGWEWDGPSVRLQDIKTALDTNKLETRSWNVRLPLSRQEARQFHAERIAYLVVYPDEQPVRLDIESWKEEWNHRPSPAMDRPKTLDLWSGQKTIFRHPAIYPTIVQGLRIRIDDGSHRLAAAYIRKDVTIDFEIHQKYLDNLSIVLPSAIRSDKSLDSGWQPSRI